MGRKRHIEMCGLCNHKIDISEKININDYDESWRDGFILVYCDECGNQIEVRRK